jgi:hypothetical protein
VITCSEFMAEFGNYLDSEVPPKSASNSKTTSRSVEPAR